MSDIGNIPFKEKPDIAQVFLRQLDRNNYSALISPDIHQSSTRQTCSNLPTKWREWVMDQHERYTNYDPRWVFKTYQGHDIGTKENPQLIDESIPVRRDENGLIDWEDPNIYSPKLDTDPPPIDPHIYNDTVNEAAEFAKLTWNLDEIEVDAGDTEEHVQRKKTPWYGPQHEEAELDDEEDTEG